MNCLTSPIEDLAAAVHHACAFGFSEIKYQNRDWEHFSKTKQDRFIEQVRRPTKYDIEVIAMFPQTWGSTALGFGGIGGAAMTTAYTIVIRHGIEFCVYFGERFAYRVKCRGQEIYEDIHKQSMARVSDASSRYEVDL